jgi:hypothetical protein
LMFGRALGFTLTLSLPEPERSQVRPPEGLSVDAARIAVKSTVTHCNQLRLPHIW